MATAVLSSPGPFQYIGAFGMHNFVCPAQLLFNRKAGEALN
jgi:hypothetical protein